MLPHETGFHPHAAQINLHLKNQKKQTNRTKKTQIDVFFCYCDVISAQQDQQSESLTVKTL